MKGGIRISHEYYHPGETQEMTRDRLESGNENSRGVEQCRRRKNKKKSKKCNGDD